MEILKLSEILPDKKIQENFLSRVKAGQVFVYPTDTVYGIGCSIEAEVSVKCVIEAKKRDPKKPLSIIVPSVQWVVENCQVSDFNKSFIENLLPGPYTVVLRAKKDSKIPKYILSLEHTIGVRIPRHPLTDLFRSAGLLVISTSANLSGQDPVTKIADLPEEIQKAVSFAVDAGTLSASSSRVFDLTSDEIKVIRA